MSNPILPLDYPDPRLPIVDRAGNQQRPIVHLITNIIKRLGGQRQDHVREARVAALQSQAMVRALTRGITTGYYHTPAEDQILSYTATSATTATINVAEHTRSTAADTIAAGSVTGVTRGLTYYVYYDDAGNAGGAVTFIATTDVSILNSAGRKTISAIYVEEAAPSGGPS